MRDLRDNVPFIRSHRDYWPGRGTRDAEKTRDKSTAAKFRFFWLKAEARSSRDFSLELGDFFDGLGPAAYAQEAPPVDDESDDETKTPS